MAIDGIKIIDSDDAFDIYNTVIERYKDGVDITQIINEVLKNEENFCMNDFYHEIYWTAFAYSLWKVGHLPDDIKTKTLAIINCGASEFWNEIENNGKMKRQKILDKLAIQLQSENLKPVKVVKVKTKRTPFFEVGDILVVNFDTEYGIVFVSAIDQTPRKIEYHLACTRTLFKQKPTIQDFIDSQIACKRDEEKYALQTDCWFNHKELKTVLDYVEKIGNMTLESYALYLYAPASTLQDIYKEITRNQEIWKFELTDITHIIKSIT